MNKGKTWLWMMRKEGLKMNRRYFLLEQKKAASLLYFLGEFEPQNYIIQGRTPYRSCSRECYISNESNTTSFGVLKLQIQIKKWGEVNLSPLLADSAKMIKWRKFCHIKGIICFFPLIKCVLILRKWIRINCNQNWIHDVHLDY